MSDQKIQDYLDVAGVIIILINKDHRVGLVNQKGCEILGFSKEEIVGKNWFDHFIPSRQRKEVRSLFELLIQGKVLPGDQYENAVLTRSGRERLISWHNTIIRDQKGKIQGTLSSGTDVTEKKKIEAQLHENENRYRSLFKESPISLWEEDFTDVMRYLGELRAKGVKDFSAFFDQHPEEVGKCAQLVRVVDVNQATLRMYKMRNLSELRQGLSKISARETFPVFKAELVALAEGKTEFESDAVNRTLKGDLLNIHLKWTVPPGYEHNLSKVYISIVDITQRVKAEREKERLYTDLRESHAKLKAMSLQDAQTGLYNHRYFVDLVQRQFTFAKRYTQPLSLIMIDIDYFKSVNEVYGHEFGDLVLQQFARLLRRQGRRYDVVIRYGGEEFILLCPGLDHMHALLMAENLHNRINLENFGNKQQNVKLKVSLAVGSYPESKAAHGMALFEMVEKILNRCKEDGGDRVYTSWDLPAKVNGARSRKKSAADIRALESKIAKLTKHSRQNLIESILAFARTIKLKDQYTGEHVEKTVQYAKRLATDLGLARDEIELVRQAAILHDLGKIGIPEKILMKKGKLTTKEFTEIKKHPLIAVDILRPIKSLHNLIPLILYHHERWDGKGYPYGLKRDEIPLGARIIALADCYEALTSDRPYRTAFSKAQALKIMASESGTKLDPKVVETFMALKENQAPVRKPRKRAAPKKK